MKVSLPKPEAFYGRQFAIAVSGGVDSMALANFCLEGRKNFSVLYFNHRTKMADQYEEFVKKWCNTHGKPYHIFYFSGSRSEKNWADWRNSIMQNWGSPVLTAHHYNDSLESYFMRGSRIEWRNGNVFRPLIRAKKAEILKYATRKNLTWIEDPTNQDNTIRRNKIRNVLIPQMVECGIDPFKLM